MVFRRNSIVLGQGRVSSAAADGEGNISFFVQNGGAIEERILGAGKNHIRSRPRIVSYADDVAAADGGLFEVRGGGIVFRRTARHAAYKACIKEI